MSRASLAGLLLLASLVAAGSLRDLPGDPAMVGQWAPPMPWGFEAASLAVLPTGKVLAWRDEFLDDLQVWDPATGALQPRPLHASESIFCAGHVLLPDGRLLVAGGHGKQEGVGHRRTFLFDPWTERWANGPDLYAGRWYPTLTTLEDGSVVAVSGRYEIGTIATQVERLRPGAGQWELVPNATLEMETYPKLHLLPGGDLVRVGQEAEVLFLDDATQRWRPGPRMAFGMRMYGSSVLLPGLDRVLVFGGWDTAEPLVPTATAEVLKLSGAPRWRPTASMHFPRTDHTGVLLPDGTVLAMGGSDHQPFGLGVLQPEVFDPAAETWTPLAPAERTRAHHSAAVLLPDARVLVAGSDFEHPTPEQLAAHGFRTAEVFEPPYLFRGPRPAITEAPEQLPYEAQAWVATPDAAAVQRAVLVRAVGATHSVSFDQRLVELAFQPAGGGLVVRAPADPTEAPPGWYLLFLLSPQGVPSTGRMVHLG